MKEPKSFVGHEFQLRYNEVWDKINKLLAKERDNQHKPSKTSTSDSTENIQT